MTKRKKRGCEDEVTTGQLSAQCTLYTYNSTGPLYCPTYSNVPRVFARDRSSMLAGDRSSTFFSRTFLVAVLRRPTNE